MGCVFCVPPKQQHDSMSEVDERSDTFFIGSQFSQSEKQSQVQMSNMKRSGQMKLSMADFQIISTIGRGAFGKVYLVEKNNTKKLYAIKILKKENIKKKKQVLHTQAERQILESMNQHPYIIQLHCAFQSDTKLYMVMDFMQGGELFFHLRQASKFTEVRAMFYCAQIVLAIEHLHRNGIIYRDLKPENILMDQDGNIKIADFGLSKLGTGENIKTYTICGTPEYLAPEIFLNQGHDQTADWWSLGSLLYEMLSGAPPFYSRNKEKMLQAILQKPIEMKDYFSIEARSLLNGLLQIKPEKRLGYQNDAEDIKNHEFFKFVDWGQLMQKKYQPPFKPRLNGPQDLRYIDKMFIDEGMDESVRDTVTKQQVDNRDFEGFSVVMGSMKHY